MNKEIEEILDLPVVKEWTKQQASEFAAWDAVDQADEFFAQMDEDRAASSKQWKDPFPGLPASLKYQPRWGVYSLVKNETKKKYDKIPVNVRTQQTGNFFEDGTGVFLFTAIKLYQSNPNKYGGVGYGFNENESGGAIGVDLDNCIDPVSHEIVPWAKEICDLLNSYTEQSVSGRGLHILLLGRMPKGLNGETRQGIHLDPIEVYSGSRFFALTGWSLKDYPDDLQFRQKELTKFVARVDARDFDAYGKAAKEAKQANAATTAATPTAPSASAASASNDGSMYPIINPRGSVSTNRITLLTKGKIVCENKAAQVFQVQDELGNEVTYPTHSHADGSLCVALAMKYLAQGLDGEDLAAAIRRDFEQSVLFRDEKGGSKQPGYLDKYTIPSAIKKARTIPRHSPSLQSPEPASAPDGHYTSEMEEEETRQQQEKYQKSLLSENEKLPETEEEAHLQVVMMPRVLVRPPTDGAPYFDADSILYGIAGRIIRKIDAESESHPAGNLLEFLVGFGNLIGRGPYFVHESTRHYTNEFGIRVGESALSRKGTGRDRVQELLRKIDLGWMNNCVKGGFGSGQAIIQAITDEIKQVKLDPRTKKPVENIFAQNVPDKRLLISEGEFSGVLKIAAMEGSLFSEVFRNAFDCKKLENTVKGSPAKCMEPFVSCCCDTNLDDLQAILKNKPNAGNGFGNRFMYAFVEKTKDIPGGGAPLDWQDELCGVKDPNQNTLWSSPSLYHLVQEAKKRGEVKRSWSAERVWLSMYPSFELRVRSMNRSSGVISSRGEAHVCRLSLLYALLDDSKQIEPQHLYAAKALWDYLCDSTEWIFGGRTADLHIIMNRLASRDADEKEQTAAQIQHAVFRPEHSKHPRPAPHVEGCCRYLWKKGYLRRIAGENGVYLWTRKGAKKVWKAGGVS